MCRTSTRLRWSTISKNKAEGFAWISITGLLLLLAPKIFAQDISGIYDVATLEHWKPINQEDILWNYENVLFRHLTTREKAVLKNATIRFPLIGAKKGLFEFYAEPSTSTVYLPVQSIRFFSDIMLAQTWLDENSYSTSTVLQYVSMLKYKLPKEFTGNRYPKPLDALQIPENAKDNPRVSEAYGKGLSSGIMFLLAHELGHVYYRHPAYDTISSAQARQNETQADEFAIELLRRIGYVPVGASFWFLYASHWQLQRYDFRTEAEWQKYVQSSTHPLTPHRMHNLASAMNKYANDFGRTEPDRRRAEAVIRSMAKNISGIAAFLEDRQMQQLFRVQGLRTELSMLGPRHTDYYVPSEVPSHERIPFSGTYKGKITSEANPDGVEIIVVLRRNRNYISGSYSYFVVKGMLRGIIQDERLYFEWSDAETSGRGVFHSTENGAGFRGTWGLEDSKDNGGSWDGSRF